MGLVTMEVRRVTTAWTISAQREQAPFWLQHVLCVSGEQEQRGTIIAQKSVPWGFPGQEGGIEGRYL